MLACAQRLSPPDSKKWLDRCRTEIPVGKGVQFGRDELAHFYYAQVQADAGQPALHLAEFARRVTLVVRADSLDRGMSHYLVRQIEGAPNIDVRLETEVVGGGGDGWLEQLVLRSRTDGATEEVKADELFLMIGAHPNTDWLPEGLAREAGGFIRTGLELADAGDWAIEERKPFSLETSMPGVFAAGDVRHGSMNRVASAVGEGSIAVRLVHDLFAVERLAPN